MATQATDVGLGGVMAGLFASSATITATKSVSPVKALGYKNALGAAPDGPPGGSASFEFIGSVYGDYDNDDPVGVAVGIGSGGTSLGQCTGMSVSVEPNQIVSSSAEFQFFNPPGAGGGGAGGKTAGGTEAEGLYHGAGAGSGGGGDQRGEFSFSASWDAIYQLGSMCPIFKFRSEASQTVTIEGSDVSGSVGSCADPCSGKGSANFTIGTLCGTDSLAFSADGYITEAGTTVSEGGVLSGTLSVIQFL
jgi:hypothetical protein